MVRDNNAIAPDLHSLLRICHGLNTLDSKRLPARNLLPRLDQPRHPIPAVCTTVPDIVNPFRACLVRLRLRINTVLRQSLLEHRVRQTQIRADAVVESVVRVRDVVVTPAELPGIDCKHARAEARLVCALEERNGELIVMRHIQLKEPRSLSIRLAHILNRTTPRRTQAVWQIQLFRYLGHGDLAVWVVDLVDADGREANGRGDLVAPDLGAGVALVGVAEHAWDDAVAVEGLAVGEVRGAAAGVGGGIVPAAFGELLFGALFKGTWV